MQSKHTTGAILAGIATALMLTVNALANILPINGKNTGEISALYPNYFVPAGFTFSIWSVIYILLIGYTVTALRLAFTKRSPSAYYLHAHDWLNKSLPLYTITCLLNAGWIIAWHYLQVGLSVIIMLSLFSVLLFLFLEARKTESQLSPRTIFWLLTPFTVYLAWICVATIANITALLVSKGYQGAPLQAESWSTILILIAGALAVFMMRRFRVPAFGMVVAWAVWGIHAQQGPRSSIINVTTMFCLGFLGATIVLSGWRMVRAR